MFPGDSMPAIYFEERSADQKLKFERQQQEAMQKAQRHLQAPQPQKPAPQNLTQAILQRPPLSRPVSTGVFGNIFQGFVKVASPISSPAHSPCATPMPGQAKELQAVNISKEMEKLIAEQKRDADICAMPTW
ncbi:hypothetical protein BAUCODRAFT_36738 [Baudoinia panamericana UAMH 10762]|uniref:Uncharacterized protein n=1 Tax=Baudoinia panamericana (strain UAMH 10762) TaxID=717646 RepID=M2N658_BAUPA|nr:uncharacterized protein BAUCODRAFT_36738 [Baudoinia panamericana UAMH 10762]EMC94270.1 hypothetical protein BAUCODRAFT_36738 [Baudoinia panamericana UAMH 10762]